MMITSLYHKVLRSFTPKFERAYIPEYHTPIATYCLLFQGQFIREGGAPSPSMSDYLVTEAKLYRSANSRHEYISLKVQGPKKLKIIYFPKYIAIERVRGSVVDNVDKKDDPNAKGPYVNDGDDAQPAGDSLPSPSVASPDKSTPMRKAEDNVSRLSSTGKRATRDQVFRTLTFSPGIPLYEVALLANTLHQMKRCYLLFSDNCYYYAGTIIKTLEEKYKPMVAVETTGSTDLDEELELKKMKKNQAGAWYGIPVYDKEDFNTEPVIAQFEQDLAHFRKYVGFWMLVVNDDKAHLFRSAGGRLDCILAEAKQR